MNHIIIYLKFIFKIFICYNFDKESANFSVDSLTLLSLKYLINEEYICILIYIIYMFTLNLNTIHLKLKDSIKPKQFFIHHYLLYHFD